MIMTKCEGGMGFRYLYSFNLALLGKDCWNFLINLIPWLLVFTKQGTFLIVHYSMPLREGGSIFIWSVICQAKEVLKKCFRWILDDGKSIDVSKDAWLREKVDF